MSTENLGSAAFHTLMKYVERANSVEFWLTPQRQFAHGLWLVAGPNGLLAETASIDEALASARATDIEYAITFVLRRSAPRDGGGGWAKNLPLEPESPLGGAIGLGARNAG